MRAFTVTLGTITSTVSSQVSLKSGCELGDGDDFRERPHHHRNNGLRSIYGGRGRGYDRRTRCRCRRPG